ncbi:hypothetical protein BH23CHL7_BH23CHL7_05100 [soil metagenome]
MTQSPTRSAQPEPSPTETAASSPDSGTGDNLAGLFAILAPALATFDAGLPSVRSGEEVIAQLEMIANFPGVQEEIDRYTENGLVERGSMSLGTTPAAGITVDRFETEAGAAADFPARRPYCDDLTVPGSELVEVVAKRCNAPDANDLYFIAHRGTLVVTLQVLELPDDQPIEPVVAMLAEVFRAADPLLTR